MKRFKVIKSDMIASKVEKTKPSYTFAEMLLDWQNCNNNMGFWQRDDWLGQQKFLSLSISSRPYCVLYQISPRREYLSYDENNIINISKPQNEPIDDTFTIQQIKQLDTIPYIMTNEDIFEHKWYCFKRIKDR